MTRDRNQRSGLLVLLVLWASMALAPAACSKMGDRPPWWPEQRPIGPELLCAQKPKSTPRMNSGPPVRDPAAIWAVVRAQYAAFEICYDNVLQRDPEATGQMWTKFVIDKHGAVVSACLERAEVDDHDGGECLLENFRQLRFPAAARDVTVTYPLVFAPAAAPNAVPDGPPPPRDDTERLKRFVVHPER